MNVEETAMSDTGLLAIIERNEGKVSGNWVFQGTRIPVSALFENLKDGATIDEFVEWFPGVTRQQIEMLLDYELTSLNEIART